MNEKKDIGALWKKFTKNNDAYLSGYIEINGQRHNITIFPNSFKNSENHPDFRILPALEKNNNFKKVQDAFDDIANKKQGQYYNNRHNESDGIPY